MAEPPSFGEPGKCVWVGPERLPVGTDRGWGGVPALEFGLRGLALPSESV